MNSNARKKYPIQGTVAPGFESVKHLYAHNMHALAEKDTQLCIYHEDRKVVDLWATVEDDQDFSPDSLVNIFSSGKSLVAIAMASLVGKGLLSYDAKISEYWPEFGGNGKEELTVVELMRHEAGLSAFNVSLNPEDLLAENIRKNKIGSIIETHPQSFPAGTDNPREYHGLTRGWIANEVFRRVDPAGRTIGEFLREEISAPLNVDVIVGLKQEELPRAKKVSVFSAWFYLRESFKPKFLGRKIEPNFFQLIAIIIRLMLSVRGGSLPKPPPPIKGEGIVGAFTNPTVMMGETPSANTHSNARSLAKVAAMMAAGGKWDGLEYLSSEAWEALHANPIEAKLGSLVSTSFTQGGVAKFYELTADSDDTARAFHEGREGFYGWFGLGGSIMQWNPEHKIGFGYVPTSLCVLDLLNERGKAYQAEVLKCIKQMN